MVNRVAVGHRAASRWVRALPRPTCPTTRRSASRSRAGRCCCYRHRGALYALDNICSHAGGLLSRGAGRGPDGDLPAARVPLRPRGRLASAAARPTSRNPCSARGSATAGSRCAAASRRHGGAQPKGHRPMAFGSRREPRRPGGRATPCSSTSSASRSASSGSTMTTSVAIHNTCTHQQQPLHEGTLQEDDTLICRRPRSRYDLTTGEAVGVFACGPHPGVRLQDRGRRDSGGHRPAAERRAPPSSSGTRVAGLALTPGGPATEDGRAGAARGRRAPASCYASSVGTWRSSGTM